MDDLRHGGPEARDRIDSLQLLSLGGAPDPVADRVRAEQFAAVARMTPFMVMCTLLYVSGLGTVLWRAGHADWIWHWSVAQLVALAASVAVVVRVQRAGAQTVAASRLRAMALCAGIHALLFNAAMLYAAPSLDPGIRAFVVAAQLAMTGAGAFFFASAPLAGLVHVGIYALGLVLLNLGSPYSPMLVGLLQMGFATTLAQGILLHAQMVARQVRSRAALADRGEVIAMLLNEYERHASDWLWESDAQHRLVRASQRLSDVLGQPLGHVVGQPLEALAVCDPKGFEPIGQAMRERKPFRAVQFRVETANGEKWLSLSGTPRCLGDTFLGYRGVGSDVTETRRTHDQIARMATSDGLTGLANRSTLRAVMEADLEGATRAGQRCALMMVDLDRFKAVNDTLGHPVGDELLREVAQRLRREVDPHGTPARLGGDEFAVMLPSHAQDMAVPIAERIIAAVSAPYQIKGMAIRVGASVGIAYGPTDAATVDDLLRAADLALYRAKADGRGVARVYAPQLRADAEERSLMEAGLRVALREGQFHLVFQPIVELASNRVRGFEALLRWTHPTLGPIPPLKFIPVAEEVGLIDPIGEWVIREACHWVARWPEEISVAINLSPRQLANPALPAVVLQALAANGVAPDRVELEITENVFLNEAASTRMALAQLRAIGVRIGLDDFGTGYSSLGYLRHAQFNTIKIDRSFVRDAVDSDGHSAEIVRHIVSLASSLGMETVAEGAETSEELEAMRALGCHQVQGFFTGRPMPPEDATALVLPPPLPRRAARAA